MKDIDVNGLFLCKYQAKTFVESLSYDASSSAMFIKRFMNSQVGKRFDKHSPLFEANSEQELIDEVNAEYNNKVYGKEKYTKDEIYWIGYIYRYWAYTTDFSSKYIYKIIPVQELVKLYYPYHTLDPADAIDRIYEAKGIVDKDRDMLLKSIVKKYMKI